MHADLKKLLDKLYLDLGSAGALSAPYQLYKVAKNHTDQKLTLNDVKQYLIQKQSYVKHVISRKNFPRRPFMSYGISWCLELDFALLKKKVSKANKNVVGLLVIIDTFSRYLRVFAVKNFTAETTAQILDDLFAKHAPINVMSDAGTSFLSKKVQGIFKKYSINFYVAPNPRIKCAIVERVIRTLKSKIYKYMTEKQTLEFISVLPKIVETYNQSYHRTIGRSPTSVTPENSMEVYRKLQSKNRPKTTRNFEFNLGDKVQISIEKKLFEGGYTQQWSDEVYEIVYRTHGVVNLYRLKDMETGEVERQFFYAEELMKVG